MTEWGSLITSTDPTGPAWLALDDMVKTDTHMTRAVNIPWKVPGLQFRLPADHWAYPVITAGFTPWAGGDDAPPDWDGVNVMWRNGKTASYHSPWDWSRGTGQQDYEIIGYKRRTDHVIGSAEPATITAPIKPPLRTHASPLVQFFRDEAKEWGNEGDYHLWSTEQTAVHYLRQYRDRTINGENWHGDLHIPTIKHCIELVISNGSSRAALERLLPPDPLDTLADQLMRASEPGSIYNAWSEQSTTTKEHWRNVAKYVIDRSDQRG